MAYSTCFVLMAERESRACARGKGTKPKPLQDILTLVRNKFESDWLAEPTSSHNDERVLAALARPLHAFDVAVAVNELSWPVRFRWVLGEGVQSNPLNESGPGLSTNAFQRAAQALSRSRGRNQPFSADLDRPRLVECRLMETAARLHQAILDAWTPSRAAVVRVWREQRHQLRTAEKLGITQQSVSEALRSARLQDLLDTEDAIRTWLGTLNRL